MHSNRMRTARRLAVSGEVMCLDRSAWRQGGSARREGVLPGGGSASRRVCMEGASAWRRVCLEGICMEGRLPYHGIMGRHSPSPL